METFLIRTENRKEQNFINALERCFDKIREHYPIEKCAKLTPDVYRTKIYREQVVEIENILTNRFGVSFRFKKKFLSVLDESIDSLPYINVIHPSIKTNVEDFKIVKEDLEETATELMKKYDKNPEMLEELFNEINTNEIMDDILRSNGLRIDINEHKVLNMPSDAYVYVNFNILYLLYSSDYPLTNRELIAILLHEVGHLFTTFHLYFRTSMKNISILREIQNIAKKKDLETKDVLVIILKRLKSNVDIKDNSTIVATIKTFRELINFYYPYSYYGKTFEEYNSDMFFRHFGLLKDLGIGLDKLTSRYLLVSELLPPGFRYRELSLITQCMIVGKAIFFLLFKTLKLFYEFPVLLATMLIWNGVMFFTGRSDRLKADRNNDFVRQDRTYDTPRRRLERIKLEMVRQLRNTKDPMLKEELLENIKAIDVVIVGNSKRYIGPNPFDWCIEWFRFHKRYTVLGNLINDLSILIQTFYNKRTRTLLEMENLEKRMEDLINNNLFVGVEQLRQVKK